MEILTFANQLTLLRLLLIPAFVILTIYHYLGWALATFVFAGATDLLDGLIARWSNSRTNVGAWLDPAADKLLLLTAFVVLTLPGLGLTNRLPVWLTVVVFSRDIGIVLTVAVVNMAVGPRTFRPSMLGKIATGVYVVTGIVTMTFNYWERTSALIDVCVYASLAIALLSGLHYIGHAARSADTT